MGEPVRWQDAWWLQQPDGTWLRFNEQAQTWEAHPSRPVYVAAPGMSTGTKVAIAAVVTVVLLFFVAIMAAIAIPVFLRQREQAWIGQVEAGLRNAAVAQESYLTTTGSYTPNEGDLFAQGLRVPAAVHIDIRSADIAGYCIEAVHDQLPNEVWSYDSASAQPRDGPCF